MNSAPYQVTLPDGRVRNGSKGDILKEALNYGVGTFTDRRSGEAWEVDAKTGRARRGVVAQQ